MGVIVFYGELSLRGLDVFPPLHVCEVFSLVAPLLEKVEYLMR